MLDGSNQISFDQIIDVASYQIDKPKITCPICKELINNPISCSSCKETYCKDCIYNYAFKNNKCPKNCKSFELVKPRKEIMDLFTKFEILCKICDTPFPLKDYYNHYNSCVRANDPCQCWNCGAETHVKNLKYVDYDEYSLEHNYNTPLNYEGDNPFKIYVTTKDISGYITTKKGYLYVDKDPELASIFTELMIEGKNYIKIFTKEGEWNFLEPHYDLGVREAKWRFCGSINIDQANQCICSNSGRTEGSYLTLRLSDKRLYFYKENSQYQQCQTKIIYLN